MTYMISHMPTEEILVPTTSSTVRILVFKNPIMISLPMSLIESLAAMFDKFERLNRQSLYDLAHSHGILFDKQSSILSS